MTVFGALAFLPACGALLDLPDTKEDDNYGLADGDGSTINTDGSTSNDGASPDGTTSRDGSTPNDGSITNPDGSLPDKDGGHTPCGSIECFGGTCLSPNHCAPYAVEQTILDPRLVAVDATTGNVYVSSGIDTIYAMSANGVVVNPPVITGESNLTQLIADNGTLYFASSGNDSSVGATVSSCTPSNCVATRHNFLSGTMDKIGGLAIDATRLYYSKYESTGTNGGGIYVCTLPSSACVKSVNVAYGGVVAVTSSELYWAEGISPNGIYSSPTGTISPTTPPNIVNGLLDLSVEGGEIFWSNGGEVARVAETGTALSTSIKSGMNAVSTIRADGNNVYWIDSGAGILYSCARPGCATSSTLSATLSDAYALPGGLALASTSLYYTTQMDNTVWRLGK